ncbi:MAG TPA: TonB family protein [Candidatus Baltobacteraceae bacterium]|nr:TonB family protein [Candidatus Baltobacteraceae bacterium]
MIAALLLTTTAFLAATECDRNPSVIALAPSKSAPVKPSAQGATPDTIVTVTVDASGKPLDVTVARSSGDAAADDASVQMARAATYAPGTLDCKPSTMRTSFDVVPAATDAEATVVEPATPVWPRGVKLNGAQTVTLEVELDAFGQVQNAVMLQSSGIADLDTAARGAALDSIYRPKFVDGHAIAAKYLFKVTFDPRQ